MKAHHFFLHWPRAVACLGLLALGLSAPALAAPCRDIATVQQSANADQNTAMGGHVTQHIYGMTPPGASINIYISIVSRTKSNTLLRCRHRLALPPALRRTTRLHHADDPPGDLACGTSPPCCGTRPAPSAARFATPSPWPLSLTMPPPLVVRLGSGCAASALEVLTAMLNRIPEPSFEKNLTRTHASRPQTEGRV